MQSQAQTNKRRFMLLALLSATVILATLLLLVTAPGAAASSLQEDAYYFDVRFIETGELGIASPAGIAFSQAAGGFWIVESPSDGSAAGRVHLVSLYSEALEETAVLSETIADPVSAAFDESAGSLVFFDPAAQELVRRQAGPTGRLNPGIQGTRIDARALNLDQVRGLTIDPVNGRAYLLDVAGPEIVIVEPATRAGRDETSPGVGRTRSIDLSRAGISNPRGIAFNPVNSHIYVFSPSDSRLYELRETGQVVATYNLAPLGLVNPQGMTFAPSGDPTDDPAATSLYLVDSGQPAAPTHSRPAVRGTAARIGRLASTGGQIVELSFDEPAALGVPADSVTGALVNTIFTSQWSPPSPDPAGIVFRTTTGTLLVTDSEVEEMNIQNPFVGNWFESTLTGGLLGTASTLSFTREPTGISVNPDNGHLFISSDSGDGRIYEIDLGSDGQFGTSDDVVSWITTGDFNCYDSEGVAYGSGLLFISDGVGREVYIVSPGINGVFDGVPPSGDDQVTHFDIEVMGLRDPEGIDYNYHTGTLFIASRRDDFVVETTQDGTVVQTIDFTAANALNPAGIAYGPSSADPAFMSLYISDRAVDNGADPNENDGRIYEIFYGTAPGSNTPTPTPTLDNPTPTPTSTSTPTATPTSDPSTATPTSTPTATPTTDPSTATPTLTPTSTPTPTVAPTATPTTTPSPFGSALYISINTTGYVGPVYTKDEDILFFDGVAWSMFFNGSDVGLGSYDVDGFMVLDSDTILMSLDKAANITGLGAVDSYDILRFDAASLGENTAGTFSLYFDGSAVGLDTSGENIDGIALLADGRLVLSTSGNFSVPGASGKDEDLLIFDQTTLGWGLYFDGSDVGLSTTSGEDVSGLSVAPNGDIYLSTRGDFAVAGISGSSADIFICTPISLGGTTSCDFHTTLFFDGSAYGLNFEITGFDVQW
jgi:uncharacterized protein YjiK